MTDALPTNGRAHDVPGEVVGVEAHVLLSELVGQPGAAELAGVLRDVRVSARHRASPERRPRRAWDEIMAAFIAGASVGTAFAVAVGVVHGVRW